MMSHLQPLKPGDFQKVIIMIFVLFFLMMVQTHLKNSVDLWNIAAMITKKPWQALDYERIALLY